MLPEAATPEADLFEILDSLPETKLWRAEILDGETITLSPTPIGLHQENVYILAESLRPGLPDGHRCESNLQIRIPEIARSVVPDLFVAPRSVLRTGDHSIAPDDVLFVAEVVSPGSRKADRVLKPEIYAKAMVELYLLVDPIEGSGTLYARPDGKRFQSQRKEPFGAKIELPDPFNIQLDTSNFLPYE
ncbi:Uma2 family endonuclease [Nocardiopsis sp. CNT-189]|uniref:Uma2 family endonuclease n=1 Tax=Nocardiopsis oceanisediminis TaxID=2816862 RepID=UPI003B3B264F